MAIDAFLKLGDIKGESKDHKYKDWIDVMAWSWGASQSGAFHAGGGGGAGKVNVSDLAVTCRFEKSIPDCLMHVANGKHIPKCTLVLRKAGEKPLEYLKITMQKVMCTSVQTGASSGDEFLVTQLSFNCAEIGLHYIEQKEDGSEGAKPDFGWNILSNESMSPPSPHA